MVGWMGSEVGWGRMGGGKATMNTLFRVAMSSRSISYRQAWYDDLVGFPNPVTNDS